MSFFLLESELYQSAKEAAVETCGWMVGQALEFDPGDAILPMAVILGLNAVLLGLNAVTWTSWMLQAMVFGDGRPELNDGARYTMERAASLRRMCRGRLRACWQMFVREMRGRNSESSGELGGAVCDLWAALVGILGNGVWYTAAAGRACVLFVCSLVCLLAH